MVDEPDVGSFPKRIIAPQGSDGCVLRGLVLFVQLEEGIVLCAQGESVGLQGCCEQLDVLVAQYEASEASCGVLDLLFKEYFVDDQR